MTNLKLLDDTAESREMILGLRNNAEIKSITPQRMYTDILQDYDDKSLPNDEKFKEFTTDHWNQTGRLHTKFSFEQKQEDLELEWNEFSGTINLGRQLQSTGTPNDIVQLVGVSELWDKSIKGQGIKVAVFDTGLRANHPHFGNVVEITNWTNEKNADDAIGHGTFVAGIIGSQYECLGLAPDSELYIFRVFTSKRASYTTWFLDAFNHAILTGIDILNLSIGGPDFMDQPFVEKVMELSANNIVVVSAIGNDGPLYGTLNNPADQLDVIGVGGIDLKNKLASFSSRGMTTWEIPHGYGRVKPDVLAHSTNIQGSRIYGGCRTLSGTSVASPVVAGAVALLASSIPLEKRSDLLNAATMKQVLVEGAERLPNQNIFEQGAGTINLRKSLEILSGYTPKASAIPSQIDLTPQNCPYMWPYCTQPLYFGALPTIVNISILNGMGVSGEFFGAPVWRPGTNGDMLDVSFSYPDVVWPYSGYLAVQISVNSDSAAKGMTYCQGIIVATLVSPPSTGEVNFRESTIEIPVKIPVIRQPPREKRLLWDQFHNLRYPSGYFPRDALEIKDEPFDWNADHIHTNFRGLYNHLRNEGYFIDILGSPWTCFDAKNYAALILADPEDEFFPAEVKKLQEDISQNGLSLVVLADWYNLDVMQKITFFDDNTKQWWTPVTGGSNVPALNELLSLFGIAFSDRIYSGNLMWNKLDAPEDSVFSDMNFYSGNGIAMFPQGGLLAFADLFDQTAEILDSTKTTATVPILGLLQLAQNNTDSSGQVVAFGDSSCFDDASPNKKPSCLELATSLMRFATENIIDADLSGILQIPLESNFVQPQAKLPLRAQGSDLGKYSRVVEQSASCQSPLTHPHNNTAGETLQIFWEDPLLFSRNSDGKFREQLLQRKSFNQQSFFGFGLILPYLFGFIVVLFVLLIALRMRTQKHNIMFLSKQPQNV